MSVLSVPPVEIDTETRILTGPAGRVRTSPGEARILAALMVAPGRLVPHDQLYADPETRRVLVFRARALLRRVGSLAVIEVVHAAGYVLSTASPEASV